MRSTVVPIAILRPPFEMLLTQPAKCQDGQLPLVIDTEEESFGSY